MGQQTNAIQIRTDNFSLDKNRLLVKGEPNFEVWAAFGETLKQVEGAVHWWIGDWLNFGEAKYGEKYAQIIEDTGFAYATVRDDKWVASRFEVSRRRDSLSYSHHKEVAGLDEAEQDRLLDAAIEGQYSIRQLRQAKIDSAKRLPIPKTHFEVIYADPPWEHIGIRTVGMKKFFDNANKNHEPMTISELCQLPVSVMATADAALFLWAPATLVDEALQVVRAWGFDYATMFIWDREKFIYRGCYNSMRHEVLLLGIRGNYAPDTIFSSVRRIMCDKYTHEKPPEFYGVIEKMYPKAKRIDLFAKKKRKNWNAYNRGIFEQYKRD